MSEVKVNKISPRTACGTTTLGDSGDTISIPAGVTITNAGTANGFGATGAVNWQTTKKTANFTASSGEGYFCDTAAVGSFTLTLPSSPSAGDIVGLKDYNGNFATANLIIGRGGSNLDGAASNKTLDTNNLSLTLVYVDATQGWVPVEEGTGFIGENFIAATGGTVTTVCTNFKVHTFTGPGTFCVSQLSSTPANNAVAYVVVAGGGGKGDIGGAGGAGGFREGTTAPIVPYTASPLVNPTGLTVSTGAIPVTVGAGGADAGAPPLSGFQGNPSIFSTITSTGGGFGGGRPSPGGPGGSGGGASDYAGSATGGTGNTPPVSPPQGNPGGDGSSGENGGGGGGATAAGGDGTGAPGTGATTQITGSAVTYATGGAGDSVPSPCSPATPRANTGGGSSTASPGSGSGIVIIRYKFQ